MAPPDGTVDAEELSEWKNRLMARSEILDARELNLEAREQFLKIQLSELAKRESKINGREKAIEVRENELEENANLLLNWARELKNTSSDPLPDKISKTKCHDSVDFACIVNVTVKDALSYVPEFDGLNTTVSDILRSCKRACSMLPPKTQFVFLTLLRQKFRGESRTTIENLEYSNIQKFESIVRSVFDHRRSANQCKAELENIIMSPDEGIISYVNRARSMHRDILHAESIELGELTDREMLKIEHDAILAFLNGLPPLLRVQCLRKPHDTLEETYLLSIDVFKNEEINAKRFQLSADNSKPLISATDYGESNQIFQNNRDSFLNYNKCENQKIKNSCSCCGQTSHNLDNCPKFVTLIKMQFEQTEEFKLSNKNDFKIFEPMQKFVSMSEN